MPDDEIQLDRLLDAIDNPQQRRALCLDLARHALADHNSVMALVAYNGAAMATLEITLRDADQERDDVRSLDNALARAIGRLDELGEDDLVRALRQQAIDATDQEPS